MKKCDIKKGHLKKDAKSFKEIKHEAGEIKKEVKKLTSRDKKVKK